MKPIIETKHLVIYKYQITTELELAYWIEKLWSKSYEDIELWDKEKYTRDLIHAFTDNFCDSL